jgi:hypothetical protein
METDDVFDDSGRAHGAAGSRRRRSADIVAPLTKNQRTFSGKPPLQGGSPA